MTTVVTEGPYSTYMVVELTTIWTPPCASTIPFEYFNTTTCAPPEYESVWYDGGYYSPAICPSGYTAGCAPTKTLRSGQTGAICVPSGWECSSSRMHAYLTDNGKTVSAPAFQIRWEEDDLSLLETHPLTPGAVATGDGERERDTGGDDPTRIPDGRRVGPTEPPDRGPPKGAVAGIVVGVALFVAIILISGFIWYRKRYLKGANALGQGANGDEKLGSAATQLRNAAGLPPVYPGVPQEMEASYQFAPPGTIQTLGPMR